MQKTICAGEGDRTLDLRIAPEFSGEVTVGMNRRVDYVVCRPICVRYTVYFRYETDALTN